MAIDVEAVSALPCEVSKDLPGETCADWPKQTICAPCLARALAPRVKALEAVAAAVKAGADICDSPDFVPDERVDAAAERVRAALRSLEGL